MDNQDTNELLLDSPKEAKSPTKENIIEQLVTMKETPFYTDALNEVNINNIITNQKPELIVLFGLNDLGKTTFVGSLYHLLRVSGKMADYKFVNSDTFAGFERRVFLRKCSKDGRSNTNVPFVLKIHFLLFIWNMKRLMKNVLLCYLIEPENAIVTIYPRMKNFLKIKLSNTLIAFYSLLMQKNWLDVRIQT